MTLIQAIGDRENVQSASYSSLHLPLSSVVSHMTIALVLKGIIFNNIPVILILHFPKYLISVLTKGFTVRRWQPLIYFF